MWAGVQWQSILSRSIYIWIEPVALSRRHLRPLLKMLDSLPIKEAIAIMDTSKPHLLRWARFVKFEYQYDLPNGKALYRREFNGN